MRVFLGTELFSCGTLNADSRISEPRYAVIASFSRAHGKPPTQHCKARYTHSELKHPLQWLWVLVTFWP